MYSRIVTFMYFSNIIGVGSFLFVGAFVKILNGDESIFDAFRTFY